MAPLTGMKEICAYCNRSESKVLDMVRNEGLPAIKVGGCWESDTELIDRWRVDMITEKLDSLGQQKKPAREKLARKKTAGAKR